MEEVNFELASPTDTPYRTPSSSRSRQWESMSPSSSPPPLPSADKAIKRSSNGSIDPANDESISPLDPRRFTPTLHASLVSEILSLRRDLESKNKDIDQLEHSLQTAHAENDTLSNSLATTSKEARSMKRQMQLLEGGTQNALNEITQERDNAHNELADLRKRFEQAQKKTRSHEENADRTQAVWDKEKETWSSEKRALETKVHIVEGRLKSVLSEVAGVQLTNGSTPIHEPVPLTNGNHTRENSLGETISGSPAKRNGSPVRRSGSPVRRSTASALSQRRQSTTSISSIGRNSVFGTMNGFSINLADELAFDEEDEYTETASHDGRISPDALPEEFERPMSSLSTKARKILGLPLEIEDDSTPVETAIPRKSALLQPNGRLYAVHEPVSRYVDSAAQYSPPPSPKVTPVLQDLNLVPVLYPSTTITTQNSQEWGSASPVSPVSTIDSRDAPWTLPLSPQKPTVVSTSCQTIESFPEPSEPALLRADSSRTITQATSQTSTTATTETGSIGTQTETYVDTPDTSVDENPFEEVRKLMIPTIAIIPPGSRPVTPETNVVLPPRTKNAGCQVNLQSSSTYDSTGMQTEDLDPRFVYNASASSGALKLGKSAPPNSSRRRFQPAMPSSTPASSLSWKDQKYTADDEANYPPNNDNGPVVRDFGTNMARPSRSNNIFAGFEEDIDESDDDQFEHDDVFSHPTARYVLKSGKLISQEPLLEDIGESSAAEAGEAIALERLRQSEDGLPPEIRNNLPRRKTSPKKLAQKPLKRVGSSKQPPNFRRTVLVSAGAAAHQRTESPTTSLGGENVKPPPFPVPIRFSSAKVGKSFSEGGRSSRASSGASPTRKEKSRSKKQQTLRKARSGPAISPGPDGRRNRSQSPPMENRISIVPKMPSFPMPSSRPSMSSVYHPSSEASAPRPSVATGPRQKTSHARSASEAVSIQQTSVVDSIAQTMVGEWMYKYVRRKSFGMPDSKANDWDPNKSVDELSANVASTGVRHKRWVWLAPYERAVMWSSKQPTSGSALMGKSGRKLTVQSVLDVRDDNPMPKNSISGQHFNRSILILTPQRALKFTAISQDRHYVWLTALSFLSHSPLSLGDLQALPPPPNSEHHQENVPAQFAGSLRRRPIRDSIRVAKGSGRPGLRSFVADGPIQQGIRPESRDYYDPVSDAALPPTVPRYSTHTRKRSNTAPRAPPSSFRGFSARDLPPRIPAAAASAASSDRGVYTPSLGLSSRRGSEASAISNRPMHAAPYDYSGPMANDLTNGAGHNATMRMDAFIQSKFAPKAPLGTIRRQHTGRGKDLSYWGMGDGSSNRDSMSPIDTSMASVESVEEYERDELST